MTLVQFPKRSTRDIVTGKKGSPAKMVQAVEQFAADLPDTPGCLDIKMAGSTFINLIEKHSDDLQGA